MARAGLGFLAVGVVLSTWGGGCAPQRTTTVAPAAAPAAALPPTITAVSPASGPTSGGTVVSVTGTGFAPSAGVTLGGTTPASVTVLGATSLVLMTAPAAAGPVTLVVTNPSGLFATAPNAFTYVAPPTPVSPAVTAVGPASGSTAGGTTVTVSGTGFATGATLVVGAAAASSVTVVSATTLTGVTPAGVAGATTVAVTNPSGTSGSLVNGFTYVAPAPPPPPPAAPTVSAVSPASGPTAGGTTITVTGTGFAAGATVMLGGVPATSVTVISATAVRGITALNVAGTVAVTVTNPGGSSGTLFGGFTYTVPTPVLLSISPTSGPTTGGTTITVTGTGFAPGAALIIGGMSASSVSIVSATTITGVTPGGAAGAWTVSVVNPVAVSGGMNGGFTYVTTPAAVTPAIYSLSPSRGSAAGGSVVTISGAGFATGATVQFRGVAATAVTVSNAYQIVCTTPAGGLGSAPVDVTNPGGPTGTNATAWIYVLGVQLGNVWTATWWSLGPTTGGTVVSLSGFGFQPGATVTFDGLLSPTVTVVNEYLATAISPQHLPGLVAVTITNPTAVSGTPTPGYNAQAATRADAFMYSGSGLLPGPTAPVVPVEGPSAGGIVVTLTGSGFQSGATVTFGGVAATSVSVVNSGTITCVAPRAPAGVSPVVTVVVANPDTSTWTAAPPVAGFVYRLVQVDATSGNSEAADVAPDGNGTVHVVWREESGTWSSGTHAIQHRRSTDNGRTWSATTILATLPVSTGSPWFGAPVVAVRGSDVFVAWVRGAPNATTGVIQALPWFASSTDGGQTFGTAAQLGSFAPASSAWSGRCDVAFDSNGGVVVLAEETTTGGNTVVSCATGTVGGQFGSPVRVSPASSTALSPRVAVVGTSQIHVAWLDQQVTGSGTTRDVHVASSTDGGVTFGSQTRLTTNGVAMAPSVVANTSRLVVGWGHSTGAAGITAVASTDGGQTFGSPTSVTAGGQSGFYGPPRLAMGAGQTVVATWLGWVTVGGRFAYDIHVVRSNDGTATWGTPVNLSNNLSKTWASAFYTRNPAVRAAGGTFVVVWSDLSLASSRAQIAAY